MFELLTISKDSEYLSIEDLAARWKKSPAWVYHNWKLLGLNPVRLGQALRFEIYDVMDCEKVSAVESESARKTGDN